MVLKASETTTENIFRVFHKPGTFIEKSAIPNKYGFKSKKATGNQGYPDFFKALDSWMIVVEAKAADHDLATADVLHYMTDNNVDPSTDIVGIAVSGQTLESLVITYYVSLGSSLEGSERVVHRIENLTALASLEDIEQHYLTVRNGDPLDDAKLVTFLKNLNERFHKNSRVRDTERSLFFSALMIALADDNFRGIYKGVAKPDDVRQTESYNLSTYIVEAVARQLRKKVNSESKQIDWTERFSFIKTVDIPLDEYKQIITDIDQNVHKPSQMSSKRDILGKAYKIFLSRAGKMDNKNIILTPDHIKSLMVDLAEIERGDVVLDTCTGSGGFLMEAMERLVTKASGDKKAIERIHEHQLIGLENDPVLFALACSNMFLHGDGRSNMLYRDSLVVRDRTLTVSDHDSKLRATIQGFGPTKCIINPPYEQDNPVLFTISALEYLNAGGKLIIIMPINTLIKASAKTLDAIFERGTLDYVIEMPGQLFFEQGRGVKTAVFGFIKKRHDKKRKVLFVDLADDGHKVRTGYGRVDTGTWKGIHANVVRAVRDQTEIDGLSWKTTIHSETSWVPGGVDRNPYFKIAAEDLDEAVAEYVEAVATRRAAQERMYAALTNAGIVGFDV